MRVSGANSTAPQGGPGAAATASGFFVVALLSVIAAYDAATAPLRAGHRGAAYRISRFAESEGIRVIAEFVEAETGADALDRRPQLAAALARPALPNVRSLSPSWTVYRAMWRSCPA
jgi:hypothetical protein